MTDIEEDSLGVDWSEVEKRFPIGHCIQGKVIIHTHFGVFVDIGSPEVRGLVRIPDFKETTDERMLPEYYPPIHSVIKGVVLGYTHHNCQVVISMKPSLVKQACG
jgi:ribosomal protein S1